MWYIILIIVVLLIAGLVLFTKTVEPSGAPSNGFGFNIEGFTENQTQEIHTQNPVIYTGIPDNVLQVPDEWITQTVSQGTAKIAGRQDPLENSPPNPVIADIQKCKTLKKCGDITGTYCGYCSSTRTYMYGDQEGARFDQCDGTFKHTAMGCQEIQDHERCNAITNGALIDTTGCGWCLAGQRAIPIDAAGAIKYPGQDKCDGTLFKTSAEYNKFYSDNPCALKLGQSQISLECAKSLFYAGGGTPEGKFLTDGTTLQQLVRDVNTADANYTANALNIVRGWMAKIESPNRLEANRYSLGMRGRELDICDNYKRDTADGNACLDKLFKDAGCNAQRGAFRPSIPELRKIYNDSITGNNPRNLFPVFKYYYDMTRSGSMEIQKSGLTGCHGIDIQLPSYFAVVLGNANGVASGTTAFQLMQLWKRLVAVFGDDIVLASASQAENVARDTRYITMPIHTSDLKFGTVTKGESKYGTSTGTGFFTIRPVFNSAQYNDTLQLTNPYGTFRTFDLNRWVLPEAGSGIIQFKAEAPSSDYYIGFFENSAVARYNDNNTRYAFVVWGWNQTQSQLFKSGRVIATDRTPDAKKGATTDFTIVVNGPAKTLALYANEKLLIFAYDPDFNTRIRYFSFSSHERNPARFSNVRVMALGSPPATPAITIPARNGMTSDVNLLAPGTNWVAKFTVSAQSDVRVLIGANTGSTNYVLNLLTSTGSKLQKGTSTMGSSRYLTGTKSTQVGNLVISYCGALRAMHIVYNNLHMMSIVNADPDMKWVGLTTGVAGATFSNFSIVPLETNVMGGLFFIKDQNTTNIKSKLASFPDLLAGDFLSESPVRVQTSSKDGTSMFYIRLKISEGSIAKDKVANFMSTKIRPYFQSADLLTADEVLRLSKVTGMFSDCIDSHIAGQTIAKLSTGMGEPRIYSGSECSRLIGGTSGAVIVNNSASEFAYIKIAAINIGELNKVIGVDNYQLFGVDLL